VTRTLEADAI
jgi:hypothetical protein